MRDYTERLIRCGIPPHDALSIVNSMVRDFGYDELEELVTSIEEETYVV